MVSLIKVRETKRKEYFIGGIIMDYEKITECIKDELKQIAKVLDEEVHTVLLNKDSTEEERLVASAVLWSVIKQLEE